MEMTPLYSGNFLLGAVLEMQKDPLTLFQRIGAMGGVVRFRAANLQVLLVSDPTAVEHILVTNARNYDKQTRGFDALRLLLGQGLLTSEGEFWRRQRAIAQPAFHRRSVETFATMMTSAAEELLSRWLAPQHEGQPFDLHADMMELTLRIVCQALLSKDIRTEAQDVGRAMDEGLAFLQQRVIAPWLAPLWSPLPRVRRARKALQTLDRVVNGVIAERRAGQTGNGDLLDMFLSARDDTGAGMTDQQLRDEVMTMFLAGHETTASALSWTFYLLSQHPSYAQRVQQELQTLLQGRTPTMEDLPKLGNVERLAKEAMRLYPPAWAISRRAVEDDQVGGHVVRRGEIVIVSSWVTQHQARWWPEPNKFDPDRFLPERESDRPKYAYFPFGGGARKCIGEAFAMMELRLILATLIQKVRLSLHDPQVQPYAVITLRPKHGLHMKIES